MDTIRIVVCDDHRLMLEAIRLALKDVGDIEIVGEAETGTAVLPLVREVDPDVVLLDIRLPGMDGLTVLARLREQYPRVKVVMLSAVEESDVIEAALKAGATAFVTKQIDPRDVASAIRQAVEGTVFQAVAAPRPTADDAARAAGLSAKEIDVLKAAARGLSNKQIGRELWLSEQTIKFHLTNVFRKLNVLNRTEAVSYALEHGLIRADQARVPAA